MRVDQGIRQIAHVVFAPPLIDCEAVSELDAAVEAGVRELVIDVGGVEQVDDDALLLLDWLAQRLENAGGSLSVAARREPRGEHVVRKLQEGDLTRVLGVSAALDKAVLRRLAARAGGAAQW